MDEYYEANQSKKKVTQYDLDKTSEILEDNEFESMSDKPPKEYRKWAAIQGTEFYSYHTDVWNRTLGR